MLVLCQAGTTLTFPVEIIFTDLVTGYYTHDRYQDTQLLLSASLVDRSWAPAAPFRHDVIRYPLPIGLYCPVQRIPSNGPRGKNFERHVQSLSATLDPEQPRCLQPLSFACLFPNLTTLDLACYSRWKARLRTSATSNYSISLTKRKYPCCAPAPSSRSSSHKTGPTIERYSVIATPAHPFHLTLGTPCMLL